MMRFDLPIAPMTQAPSGARLLNGLAISPDGMRIAYVTAQRLMVRSLDQAGAVPLPGTEPNQGGFAIAPFFSPDGQTVAFFQQGQLKKIAISGGGPVKICDLNSEPFGATWGQNDELLLGTIGGVVRVDVQQGTPELLFPQSGTRRQGSTRNRCQADRGSCTWSPRQPAAAPNCPTTGAWSCIRARPANARWWSTARVSPPTLHRGIWSTDAATRCLPCPSTR